MGGGSGRPVGGAGGNGALNKQGKKKYFDVQHQAERERKSDDTFLKSNLHPQVSQFSLLKRYSQ